MSTPKIDIFVKNKKKTKEKTAPGGAA